MLLYKKLLLMTFGTTYVELTIMYHTELPHCIVRYHVITNIRHSLLAGIKSCIQFPLTDSFNASLTTTTSYSLLLELSQPTRYKKLCDLE